jgi:hypothetical protein
VLPGHSGCSLTEAVPSGIGLGLSVATIATPSKNTRRSRKRLHVHRFANKCPLWVISGHKSADLGHLPYP